MATTLSVTTLTIHQAAKAIDHSLLRPELTAAEVEAGCDLARRYDVASVCVKPLDVALASARLAGSEVAVGTVVGFPHGSHRTDTKVFEAERALADGATELDLVIAIGRLVGGDEDYVREDLAAVVDVARKGGALTKVILENAYLTDEQKVRGCQLSEAAGADFVKTSTGFAPSGATHDDLRLMRRSVSPHIQVKAAGGVRSLDAMIEVLALGVTRIGATRTAEMLDELAERRKAAGLQD
jgi:deoxyribose-phosphate aldolase